ncbi:M6 family metalloprotease domain-containing protein [Streptomyces tanashiensis]
MEPSSSAIPMNRFGASEPNCGWFQRTSASTPRTAPSARSSQGLVLQVDLPDLYHRPVDGKGDWDTHVGDWDVMGSQFGLSPDLFGWHKWKLGWLSRAQVTCVQGSGPRLVSLEPTDTPPTAGGILGTRLAVVRTGPDSVLAIEARSTAGNDADTCTEGVLVYRVRNGAASGEGPVEVVDAHPDTEACAERSVYPPLADAPVEEGETLTVPGTGVRVEVTDRSGAGVWTVKITPPGRR